MHADPVGDLLHFQGFDRLRPLCEKPRLVIDDRLRGLEERAPALFDGLDEPLGGVDLSLDVFAGGRLCVGRQEHLPVDGADPQARQVDVFQPHLPRTVRPLIDEHIGLDRGHDRRGKHRPGLRLQPVEFLPQSLDLLEREAGPPLDERQPIGAKIFEVIAHEPPQPTCMRRRRGDLQQQALPQIAGTHAGRIHALHDPQRRLEVGQLCRLAFGAVRIEELLQGQLQVSVGVEVVDDLVGGLPHGRREIVVRELLVEVIAERLGSLDHVGHHVEVAVARLLDLGRRWTAPVVVAVGILRRPVVRTLEVGLIGMVLIDDQRPLVHWPLRHRRLCLGAHWSSLSGPGLLAGLVHLQRLVVLDLLLDPLLERHHRQLQNLHRLDHARRKHLLLRHPHFLAERHPHGNDSCKSRAGSCRPHVSP